MAQTVNVTWFAKRHHQVQGKSNSVSRHSAAIIKEDAKELEDLVAATVGAQGPPTCCSSC